MKSYAKKILILGPTGMLGNAVYREFKDKYDLILALCDRNKIKLLKEAYGETKNQRIVEFDADNVYLDFKNKKGSPGEYLTAKLNEIGEIDYVINGIGLVIAPSNENPEMALFINGALPHILAGVFGKKLIHITTDCAFNGKEGFPYDEKSVKSPNDIYGLSKTLGEPTNCLTLRTSIIGRELETYSGLLEWFLQQKGKTITGFDNHYWNGITTKEFALICDKIISNSGKFPETGLYHVFSEVISKYEMLLAFREKYKIDCEIKRDTEQKLNRSLSSVYSLCRSLKIPSFKQMLAEL